MQILRAYKVRLNPTVKQKRELARTAGACRFVWNWALGRRIEEYKTTGKSSTWVAQSRQLTQVKQIDFPWLREVHSSALVQVISDVDRAYQNFFRRVKKGEKPGFPKFKSKNRGVGHFRFQGGKVAKDKMYVPKIGWINLFEHGYIPIETKINTITISERAGFWFASVQCVEEIEEVIATGDPIGLDLGIKTLVVTSEDNRYENPKVLRKALVKLARIQRELCRRKKGSNNRRKTKERLSKFHLHVANLRQDIIHKITTDITGKNKPIEQRPNVIVMEDLNVKGMIKNRRLAQAISDASFDEIKRQIEYKTKWYGGKLELADRWFPSSKTCPSCGLINDKLTLKERMWTCECGAVHDRDLNAAKNLRDLVRQVVPEPAERQTLAEIA